MEKNYFSKHEFEVLSDKDFFYTKRAVNEKLIALLEVTQRKISEYISSSGFPFPEECHRKKGKISKGENYNMLPWFMLDYPAFFTQKDIFAFRTMFWWGECFSCTFLMSGEWMKKFQICFKKNYSMLSGTGIYFCVNESPWEHHFGENNYKLLESLNPEFVFKQIEKAGFLKLSIKIKLEEYEEVPDKAVGFVGKMLGVLEGKYI